MSENIDNHDGQLGCLSEGMEPKDGNIQAAIEAGRALGSVVWSQKDRWALHEGQLIDLDDVMGRPAKIHHAEETRIVHSLESFLELFNRFAREGQSTIFADMDNSRIVGIIDYHEGYNEPGRKEFKIQLDVAPCADFVDWTDNEGRQFQQEEFAEWIEERARFFVEPKAAVMLEIATSLVATRECQFERSADLQSGDHHLRYTEQTEAKAGVKQDLEIPKTFTVGLPYQIGGNRLNLEVLLRFRIRSGELFFSYRMPEKDEIRKEHFSQYVDELRTHANGPVYLGLGN